MSVNLIKNKAEILDAWKSVVDNKDGYDWALFGYEGKTPVLKVDAIGSGGIETVTDELNDGKIQYAFLRVLDPNTQLVKFLLVNFQGEAVLDLVHKGTCSNHIGDISRLLKNHLTITASNSDDLDEDVINKKVSNITSAYNFQDRAAPTEEKFNIGTNYSKVVPTKEINTSKRDEFWKKEEEMEKGRVASELAAKKFADLKIEEERLKREQNEHQKRELMNKEPDKRKLAPTPAIQPVSPVRNVEKAESMRPRADEMRADRRKEAQELIGNRVNTAKAMFQQQAAQSAAPPPQGPPAKPIRKTIQKVEPEPTPATIAPAPAPTPIPAKIEIPEPVAVVATLEEDDGDDSQFATIKRSPKTPTSPDNKDNGFAVVDNVNHQQVEKPIEQQHQEQEPPQQKPQSLQFEEVVTVQQQLQEDLSPEAEGEMLKAVALYDYQAIDDTEISFDPGDVITHIDRIDEGWWQGYSERFQTYGLFPANYVELIP